MFLSWTIRFLRKKIVLAIIFGLSLSYCLLSIIFPKNSQKYDNIDVVPMRRANRHFNWHQNEAEEMEIDANETALGFTCRNSVQGKLLIADDRGYICSRSEVLANGCCNVDNAQRYNCDTCKENGCCAIYENCISCCLDPQKKTLLQELLEKVERSSVLFSSVNDLFELCLSKCRTSSVSVQHENSYIDSKYKHCYSDVNPGSNTADVT